MSRNEANYSGLVKDTGETCAAQKDDDEVRVNEQFSAKLTVVTTPINASEMLSRVVDLGTWRSGGS